jgi:hypothetical protein
MRFFNRIKRYVLIIIISSTFLSLNFFSEYPSVLLLDLKDFNSFCYINARHQIYDYYGKRIFFALNLHQNEEIMENMIINILKAITILGRKNVFVSIYESGSSDKTVFYLNILGNILKHESISHSIVTNGEITRKEKEHRIEFMAKLRNKVLEPYFKEDGGYDYIVFLNDVIFCFYDILELLNQHEYNGSDMTCPLDYDMNPQGNDVLGFYDTWVAQDINGDFFEKRPLDLFVKDFESRKKLYNNTPFQVYCCWNGIAVLNANPFNEMEQRGDQPVSFKRYPTVLLEEEEGKGRDNYLFVELEKENSQPLYISCSGSEISSLCKQFHAKNYTKAIVVPLVKVAYDWESYKRLHNVLYRGQESRRLVDPIVYKDDPKTVACLPMNLNGARSPDGILGRELLIRNHLN